MFVKHLLHARYWVGDKNLTAASLPLGTETSNPTVITIQTVSAQPGAVRKLWGHGGGPDLG